MTVCLFSNSVFDERAIDLFRQYKTAVLKQPEVVLLLLDHGANVDAQDGIGHTALIQAVGAAQGKSVRYLLAHGANVNLADKLGNTVLHQAVDPHYSLLEKAGAKP